jgi:hypothetical protein
MVMLHAYMINISSNQGEGSNSDESSEESDAHDKDDVESYQYEQDKMMECTMCKAMVTKKLYPYCYFYRDTSGEDHDAHRFVYCSECKLNVTQAQSLNKSCHTNCLVCGEDRSHDNCIKYSSKPTRRTTAKTERKMKS